MKGQAEALYRMMEGIARQKKIFEGMTKAYLENSTWRMLLLAIVSLAMAVGGYLMAIHSPKGFHIVVGWIGVVFFGVCGIYMLYGMLKERLTGKPFLTITDEAVIMDGMKHAVIHFADVESFNMVKMGKQEFVAVHYMPGVELKKMDEANALDRSIRKLKIRMPIRTCAPVLAASFGL